MNKFFYCLIPLFYIGTVQGQITYPSSSYANVGDTFVISTVSSGLAGIDVASTGANYNWVFDSLEVSDQNVLRIEAPDNTGYFLTWFTGCVLGQGNIFTCPGIWNDLTDHAISDGEDFSFGGIELSSAFNFYKKSTSTYEATIYGASFGIGGVSIPIAVNYEDIDTLYQFPLTYLAKDSSFSRLRLNASSGGTGIVSVQEHRRTNEVDGWGSLTTPFATYDSVLRMKTTLINNDTIILNGNPVSVPTTDIEYKWFDKANGQPVMTAFATQTILGEILGSIQFQDTLRCLTPNAGFLFFPPVAFIDSATGLANVNFFNQSGNSSQYSWDFSDGTSSTSVSPNHDFAPGIYGVELVACNTICNPLECDTITLPVTVINGFAPIALLGQNPGGGCVNNPVLFNNNSINAQTYFWDFGDGTISTDESPTHLYAAADTYQVQLIAINGRYRDTTNSEIIIYPTPTPELGNDTIFLPSDSMLSLNPGSFLVYQWSSGTFAPTFDIDGDSIGVDTMIIWVEVTDLNGCSERDSMVIIGTQATSIENSWINEVNIYPNPVRDQLTITVPRDIGKGAAYTIVDLSGRVLQAGTLKSKGHNHIDLRSQAEGFYFIQVEISGQKLTRKLFISR